MLFDRILDYPELLAAGLLAVVVPAAASVQGEFAAPGWISKPAVSFAGSLPDGYFRLLKRWLTWVNLREQDSLAGFCSAKLVLSVALLLVSLVFDPLYAPLAALGGYILPDVFLCVRVKRRQAEIRNTLPQALDLMVMCVDAGLAMDATVQRIALERSGIAQALNDELTSLGRDLLLGTERERAYQLLYARTGVDELKALGSALNQSAKMGLSIAKVLRSQSEYMRNKQRIKAEEKALKMPIYMAFPMWFCIMPALLIVVLAPSIITFLAGMGRL